MTLALWLGLLTVHAFPVGAFAAVIPATTYKASMYGLDALVKPADREDLRMAFYRVNKGSFTLARDRFARLAETYPAIRPFWESTLYLKRSYKDLCQAWWRETIDRGLDYSLAQKELQYLLPLNSQTECINEVANDLLIALTVHAKEPTPLQAAWFWRQVPRLGKYSTSASLALARAYRHGFGYPADLDKSAQWYLATLRDEVGLGPLGTMMATSELAEVLFMLAEEKQSINPSAAHHLYSQSLAYAMRASQGSTDNVIFMGIAQANVFNSLQREQIIEQALGCQDEPVRQCSFYTFPTQLDLQPLMASAYPRDRIIQRLVQRQYQQAYEYAKKEVQLNLPVAWAFQLYTSLLIERYDQALFRLSYLSFEANGLDNELVSAIAARLDSPRAAKQVMMYAAAAVLSSGQVDAATATRAIDYLGGYASYADAQELLYLSQVFSRPLTPAYNLEKAIHLAARAFKAQPALAATLQMERLWRLKKEEQWQHLRDAWRLIALGLMEDDIAGVFEDFAAENAAEAAKALAAQCQSAGLIDCDLIDASQALYNQSWPAAPALASPSEDSVAVTTALKHALLQYTTVNDPERIDALDQLMRQHAAPVLVPTIASDMQRLDVLSDLILRYTLLAGALGKGGDWDATLTKQASKIPGRESEIDVRFYMGQAYGGAAEDLMGGFPVQNQELAELFYEQSVLLGQARIAQAFADRLREGKGFEVDNQRALKLYEYAVQQRQKRIINKLPAYLAVMTDIREHQTKAYAYALMSYQTFNGTFLSEEQVMSHGIDLSPNQKEQAQQWADDCLSKDFYLCEVYEANNALLRMPGKK